MKPYFYCDICPKGEVSKEEFDAQIAAGKKSKGLQLIGCKECMKKLASGIRMGIGVSEIKLG